MAEQFTKRTLLVGLDAGCMNVLQPYFEEGALPTLQSLFEEGAAGTLASQIPPWTASAWPTIYTGVNPGKHGVFDFLKFDGYDWDLVDSSTVRELTLWELLDYHGLCSVVVNVPVTHPPPEINGAVIPGYIGPNRPECHPSGILEEVESVTGDYYVYPRTWKSNGKDEPLLSELVSLTRSRGLAFDYLREAFDPDFGFIQFQQTDTVFHEFPGDRDKARQIYAEVDRQLETILDGFEPDTILVVSDHGMDAYDHQFRINDFLYDAGYVEVTRGGEGMPTWAKIRDSGSPHNRAVLTRLMERIARVGFTSQRIGTVLNRLQLTDIVLKQIPDNLIRAASEQVDFPKSTAYMRSRVEMGVRINLEGREPNGVVPAEEYDRVRDDLISQLEAVRGPDGEPVFQTVAPREQFFHGPYVDEAVDIITVPREFKYYLSSWLLDEQFDRPDGPSWDHTLEGILAVTGPGVDEGASIDGARPWDIAPTVLASLGVPISTRMDGSPIGGGEPTGVDSYPHPGTVEHQTDLPEVERRLANMGYLEGR